MSIANLKRIIRSRWSEISEEKYSLFIKRLAVSLGLITFIATYLLGIAAYGLMAWVAFGWFPSGLIAWITANLVYQVLRPADRPVQNPSM